MSTSRKSLKKPRSAAFKKQKGLCYYCHKPMWQENIDSFARDMRISQKKAKNFQCTGEHLTPHKNNGKANGENIVAACKFCNQKRHQRKIELSPTQYMHYVQTKLNQGKWNTPYL